MIMKITIEEEDKIKAKRLVSCDDAFGLLWDIDQHCRGILKYDEKKTRDEALEEIREMIYESSLLDLWQ